MSTEEKVKDLFDKWYSGEIPYTEYHEQLMSIIEEERRIYYGKGFDDYLNINTQTKDIR